MKRNRLTVFVSCLFVLSFLLAPSPARTAQTQGAQERTFDSVVAWYSGTYVQVSWDQDATAQVRGYNVYRSIGLAGPWEKLNQEPFEGHVFVDYSAPRDSSVIYRVKAIGLDESEQEAGTAAQVSTAEAPELASILTAQAYDKNNIITDTQLTNAGAMTVAQIQTFLTNQGSVLANYSTGGKTAAQHIYDNCQTHGISPYVVLVTLQKEKGLIRSSSANPNSFAMGWNTGDSSTADFANQVYYGTRQFKLYYNNLGGYGWTVGQAHGVSDGTVTPASIATTGLYIYTPWIGQGGGGQVGVGGNYLFWDLWYNTFGFPSATLTLPTSVLSPVVGPLRVTSSNLGIPDGKWEFDQHMTGFHRPGGGIGGSDDTYAWDANWYKPDDHNADVGQNVYATADGDVVLFAGVGLGNSCNAVLIAHPNKDAPQWWSGYLHLAQYNVSFNQHVTQSSIIGTVGRSCVDNDHLHFVIYRGQNVSGGLISFNAGINERTASCAGGSSESYRVSGSRPPVHPNSTLIKASADPTVYLMRGGQKMWVTSPSVLANLYQQANSNFSNDVITVASDELNRYPTGANISGALPSNGRGQPEGRLIRQSGGTEVSIVTDGGHRRPFATEQAFLGLGYQFCKVIDVSDYFSYPQGPPVEAMPLITGSVSLNPSGPYSVGQTITGTFSLTNIGTASVTFPVVTIGGRLSGSTVTDFPFHTNVTVNAGQTIPYQDAFTFPNAGTYSFFPAYQTQDGVWRIGLNHEIPTDPGITDLITLNVGSCSYSVSPPTASYSSSGGPGSFSLTTQAGCTWSASSDVSWITTSSSGTGSGAVNYFVAQNTSTSSRTGHVTVQGQAHTVTQSGIACTYSVSPPSASFSSSGGAGSFSATTQTGCGWSASSDVAWITTSSSGTGSATVSYSVSPNSSSSPRTGHVTVQGQVHTVTQSGAVTLQPDLVVTSLSAPSTGSIGGQITVSCTIVNQGAANSGAFRLGYYFSTDNIITTGDVFTGWGCTYASGLAAGTSTTCNGQVGVPSLPPGIYYFGAIADDQGQVAESNEANNARAADTGPVILSDSGCTPIPISIGQTANGALTTIDCPSWVRGSSYYADRYSFNASAGQQVAILLGSTTFDTYLYLLGPSGAIVAQDDDGGGGAIGTDSRIPAVSGYFTLPSTGTYIIEATSFDQNVTGNYTLGLAASSPHLETIGLYWPVGGAFFFKYSNSTGPTDYAFTFGPANQGWTPVIGDWDGDGISTIGLYYPGNGAFFIRNSNNSGIADIYITYGPAGQGWLPVIGDWDGNGTDTVGLYNPGNGFFYLRNSNTVGFADLTFSFGPVGQGWIPIVGDWDGDGVDTVGLYNPATGAVQLRNSNTSGAADVSFTFTGGGPTWNVIVGDWDGNGTSTLGLYNPATGVFMLRNSNTTGGADISITWAAGGYVPVAGKWQ